MLTGAGLSIGAGQGSIGRCRPAACPHGPSRCQRRNGAAAADSFTAEQNDPSTWLERSEQLAALFATRTRDEWCALLEGSDACLAPVLTLHESFEHAHMKARCAYVERAGHHYAAAAPRFSRTPGAIVNAPTGEALLRSWTRER